MKAEYFIKTLVAFAFIALSFSKAFAADTTETWAAGATDVDFYTGFDGIGLGRPDQDIYGDIMYGYGLATDLSGYAGMRLQADGYLAHSNPTIYLGLYGTPIDTAHFDMDLFLDFSACGPGLKNFALTPSIELNYDYLPDLKKWGLYMRIHTPIYTNSGSDGMETDIETTEGTYWTIRPGHQVLLEFDLTVHPYAKRHVEIGGIALGYNVEVYRWGKGCGIEMINQVYLDIPQAGESFSAGLMTGMIVTLPSDR